MKIDAHVHLVGNGTGGTGCWLRSGGWRAPIEAWMEKHIGLPRGAMQGDLDRLIVERLVELVRESSLDAAVVLAMDRVYDPDGTCREEKGSFYVPNAHVLAVGKKYPELLPAVSIHPARRDALDELDKCLEGGAVMLKLLPNCHNIDCNDPRYTGFWERMAEAGLPLLAHTGGEHTVPVVRKELADPRTLELPLKCGVNVIAAHCGTKSGLFDTEYFYVFVDMLRRYPNLYGDSSAFNVPIRGRHVRECLQDWQAGRILHGSDYPVPVHGHFAWLKGYVDWSTFRRWERHPNILERDYQLKRAMGFPEASFTRIWDLFPRRFRKAG
jgi:predicted TIM-barrel fold metal-dependent hydrolase